jgi:FkbM family methyltransferase
MIFDIGANIGNWALANINKTNTIVCVEASPYIYIKLLENTKLYNNIICISYAVSDSKNDTVEFYDCSEYNGGLSTINKDWLCSTQSRFYGTKIENTLTIKTISLDYLIETYGMPELIKIDVEGAEESVINSLSQKVNLICFEWASEWKDSLKRCIDRLVYLGFTRFYIQNEDNYNFRPTELNITADMCKNILDNTIDKVHWGMIWAA